jgi:hypothetical protein
LNLRLLHLLHLLLFTPIFNRHDMFEPFVAVSSFFVFIHGWLGVDWLASSGKRPGLRKYQIVPKALINDNADDSGGDVAVASTPSSSPPPSSSSSLATTRQRMTRWYYGWYKELAVYLLPLWALAR